MDIVASMLIVLGLVFFEVIVSVDNAIVNADVLSRMSRWARRWFLVWGFLIAVVIVRGLFPLALVWISNPQLGVAHALTATFGPDNAAHDALQKSAPILLIGGGTFLLLLFLHWSFKEPKNYGFSAEKLLHEESSWFSAAALLCIGIISFFAFRINHAMAYAAIAGAFVFFISDGFRESAGKSTKTFMSRHASDFGKILYLELLDASFSVDSVLGAFAFTMSVPLIMVGNGIGVLIIRNLTVRNIKKIEKFKYLKNGAMYSILALSIIMILESFGLFIPEWVSPMITFIVVGYFFYKSLS
jgi:uncharacterized protein